MVKFFNTLPSRSVGLRHQETLSCSHIKKASRIQDASINGLQRPLEQWCAPWGSINAPFIFGHTQLRMACSQSSHWQFQPAWLCPAPSSRGHLCQDTPMLPSPSERLEIKRNAYDRLESLQHDSIMMALDSSVPVLSLAAGTLSSDL